MRRPSPTKHLINFLWTFFKGSPLVVSLLLLVSFTWSFDSTLWPYTLKLIVDTLTANEIDRSNILLALKTPIIYGLSLWFLIEFGFRLQGTLLARFIPKLEANIRMTLFNYIQYHSPRYFNTHLAGSLTTKITDMTTHTTQALWQCLYSLIPAFGTFLVSLYFYSQVNLVFTFILCCLVAVYVVICALFSRKCTEKEQEHAESRSSLLGKILDSFSNNFAVNLFFRFRAEKNYIEHFQKIEQKKHYLAKKYVELMRMCLSAAFLSGGVIINAWMIYLWKNHRMSTGEIVQIFNMTWNIILILWYAGAEIPSFFQSVGILKQAISILKDPQDVPETSLASPLQVSSGEITFKNVGFDYPEKNLFDNLSIQIRSKEKVGLVGYSGSGKSTFVNLILNLYPLKAGEILIDGQDLSKISLESLRHQIAFIPQDPILFHRTIEENILYGRPDASQEEMIAIAKIAECHDFIESCALGYQTIVGERGSKLSGGERQRVAIARALLSKAPIVILDEATSALDVITEKYIQKHFEKLFENKTAIVIAHRLSTLTTMDRILVFDQGKIIEDGSHEELLEKQGHYFQMWKMQTNILAHETLYASLNP